MQLHIHACVYMVALPCMDVSNLEKKKGRVYSTSWDRQIVMSLLFNKPIGSPNSENIAIERARLAE